MDPDRKEQLAFIESEMVDKHNIEGVRPMFQFSFDDNDESSNGGTNEYVEEIDVGVENHFNGQSSEEDHEHMEHHEHGEHHDHEHMENHEHGEHNEHGDHHEHGEHHEHDEHGHHGHHHMEGRNYYQASYISYIYFPTY